VSDTAGQEAKLEASIARVRALTAAALAAVADTEREAIRQGALPSGVKLSPILPEMGTVRLETSP